MSPSDELMTRLITSWQICSFVQFNLNSTWAISFHVVKANPKVLMNKIRTAITN